ncbi:MAG: preprotein translocase subunit SecG [Candidatus Omnitrophica bacterium]|nr:preprotein translocase subunit SecG [Candidatus Omnitrophota bacterium]
MMLFIVIIHAIVCVVLISIVLVQKGRGGGLVDSLQGVESMFGTRTPAFLTRTTTICSILFFITCLSLAVLSLKQSKSLMQNIKPQTTASEQKTVPAQPAEAQNTAPAAPAVPAATPGAPLKPQDVPKAK